MDMRRTFVQLMFLGALAGAAMLVSVVQAQSLRRPDQLMSQAKLGRSELREVLLDMMQEIPELRDRKSFEERLLILDDLQELAVEFRLGELYPKGVEILGNRMVAHGVRWLDLTHDEKDLVGEYHQWADASTSYGFQDRIRRQIRRAESEAEWSQAAKNLDYLSDWAASRFPDDVYIAEGYVRLLSQLALERLAKSESLPFQEFATWVGRLKEEESLYEFVVLMQREVFASDRKEKQHLSQLLGRMNLVFVTAKERELLRSHPLFQLLSDSSVELLIRILDFEVFASTGAVEAMVSNMNPAALQALAHRWSTFKHGPSSQYMTRYLETAQILMDVLRRNQLHPEARTISDLLKQRLAPLLIEQRNREGTYHLRSDRGEMWKFTLIRSDSTRLLATLADSGGFVSFTFFNIEYDAEENVFLASENYPDDDHYANHSVRFSFNGNDNLVIEAPYAQIGLRRLEGRKSQSYPSYLEQPYFDGERIEGEYKGRIRFPDGETRRMTLTVVGFGAYSIGRLESESGNIRIEFQRGTDGRDGFIYLTSGELQSGKTLHLRAVKDGGTLKGRIIVGGSGISRTDFDLQKTK